MLWLIIFGAPVAFATWAMTFVRWRYGVMGLLVYLPVAGAVSLWLASYPVALLFKDLFFVIPIYLAVALLHLHALYRARVPFFVTATMILFGLVVLAEVFNPKIPDIMIGAIGAKVWLMYLPLVHVAAAMCVSTGDVVRLFRLMVAVAVVPCAVGLIQLALANTIGYQAAIELFYGEAAKAATQGFSRFEVGGLLYRIPSTFSFVFQYAGYTLAMIVPAYALTRLDPSRRWRSFARVMLALIIVAGFLTGSRGNFVFIPLLLAMILIIDGRLTGVLAGAIFFPVLVLAALYLGGLDPLSVLGLTSRLVSQYGSSLVLPDLITSIQNFPLGQGTGMNTGPARHVMSEAAAASFVAYEGYYAKTIAELGIPGLVLIVTLFGTIVFHALRSHFAIRDRGLKSASAALTAFLVLMMLHSLKGWQVDLDPINVYFWLFAGMALKLRLLDTAPAPSRAPAWSRPAHPAFRR